MEYVWFWVIAGAAVGALATLGGRHEGRGALGGSLIRRLIGGVLVGVLGAVVAGWLLGAYLVPSYHGWIGSTVAASAGAVVLLFFARAGRRAVV